MESIRHPTPETSYPACLSESLEKLRQSYDFASREINDLITERSPQQVSTCKPQPLADSLTALVNDMPAGVVVLDRHNKVLLANPMAIMLFEVPLLESDFLEVIQQTAMSIDASGQQLKLWTGRSLSIVSHVRPTMGDQIVILNDVSAMADWLGLEGVGQSTALMAHQLRTPLSAAILYLGQLSTESKQAEVAVDTVGKLGVCLKQLEFFINKHLENTRWINCPLKDQDVSLKGVLQVLEKTLAPIVEKSGGQFSLDLPDEDLVICSDEDALLAALTAIAENALAIEDGVSCMVSATVSGRALEITVSDNGPGIPKENLSKIFNPFYTTRQGGSGLGLTMAYQIAQRFDGDLTASNRPSGGASFLFRLPLTRVRSCQQSPAGK
ncbi:MAG: HAMP domain-containing histidine kinase [Gammaproteobacteria bacterium]|nr:HAMP domain-containing histidine kinase [Gammaproteobacteria bacterium]MBT6893690.1 HAMP domain-containing histidine kinase [Gammaproteobacteria bacterium]